MNMIRVLQKLKKKKRKDKKLKQNKDSDYYTSSQQKEETASAADEMITHKHSRLSLKSNKKGKVKQKGHKQSPADTTKQDKVNRTQQIEVDSEASSDEEIKRNIQEKKTISCGDKMDEASVSSGDEEVEGNEQMEIDEEQSSSSDGDEKDAKEEDDQEDVGFTVLGGVEEKSKKKVGIYCIMIGAALTSFKSMLLETHR